MAQSMQQIKQPKKREGSSVGYFRSGNLPREGNASSSDTMVTNAEFDQQAYSSASFAMHHSGRRSSRGSKKKKGAAENDDTGNKNNNNATRQQQQ